MQHQQQLQHQDNRRPAARSETPRLLLVDDEPRLRNSLRDLLRCIPLDVHCAGSGREAIALLQQHRFDLALLDLGLPDMSGHQIMDQIRAHGQDPEIIVVSGNTDIDSAIGALQRGAFDYVRKPYEPDDLLQKVQNALEKRRLARENRQIRTRLANSERMYRYLVDASPDLIYMLDHQGRFSYVNERAEAMLGFKSSELLGRHFLDFIHEDDLDRAQFTFNERRRGPRAARNVELRVKCGESKSMSNHAVRDGYLTISLNATGLYSQKSPDGRPETYLGTYGVARDVSERKRAEERVAYHAYYDTLTDLPNRVLFNDRLSLAIIQATRNTKQLAVMFIDLDRFKTVNDTLGHIKGDEMLREVSARLKSCVRKGDTLARLGGDEFALFLPDIRARRDAEVIARKILDELRRPFVLDEQEFYISCSIGIAHFPEDGATPDSLLRHADIAMYHIKSQGKNGFTHFALDMQSTTGHLLTMEADLRRAFERGEFEMFYQPQYDVATLSMVGCEALIRWHHPSKGLMTAGEFIPYAEEAGLIERLCQWALRQVCLDLKAWHVHDLRDFRVAVNISPKYLERDGFVDEILDNVSAFGIAPETLELEITENICIKNVSDTISKLQQLADSGLRIAIDDFGTRYSSLNYLHRLPFHTIKIDQSFVHDVNESTLRAPVITAIISIARGLGLNVIAEGVETPAQMQFLEKLGCREMQGYFFSTPVPKGEIATRLATHHAPFNGEGHPAQRLSDSPRTT
ncbi:EAL domain-containing protein [Chitinivorax sp. PXF-14]|uniref:putative bifunctional diguanylate cyclase/phosphodiesterase n=1 Tax=Chitinivorax sp. PXF-14 TaxID=3230488 RepID=UPI003465FC6D